MGRAKLNNQSKHIHLSEQAVRCLDRYVKEQNRNGGHATVSSVVDELIMTYLPVDKDEEVLTAKKRRQAS